MIRTVLHDGPSGKDLAIVTIADQPAVLAIGNVLDFSSRFAAVNRTTAGTSTIVEPNIGGHIIVRDIIITARNKANSLITLSFTDGVNATLLLDIDNTNGTQLHIPLASIWQGWKDARVELVTSGASFNCNVTISFIKIKSEFTLSFDEWSEKL